MSSNSGIVSSRISEVTASLEDTRKALEQSTRDSEETIVTIAQNWQRVQPQLLLRQRAAERSPVDHRRSREQSAAPNETLQTRLRSALVNAP